MNGVTVTVFIHTDQINAWMEALQKRYEDCTSNKVWINTEAIQNNNNVFITSWRIEKMVLQRTKAQF